VATLLLRRAVFTLFPGHAIVVSHLQCVVGMVCSCEVGYTGVCTGVMSSSCRERVRGGHQANMCWCSILAGVATAAVAAPVAAASYTCCHDVNPPHIKRGVVGAAPTQPLHWS
jgi:hypothetical protein